MNSFTPSAPNRPLGNLHVIGTDKMRLHIPHSLKRALRRNPFDIPRDEYLDRLDAALQAEVSWAGFMA